MSTNKHDATEILAIAVQVSDDIGIGRLTFGAVARRAGIPDRTVVYYFPTKRRLLEAVLEVHSTHLMALLGTAFRSPASDAREMVRAAWPALATPSADPAFRTYLEVIGLSVRGVEPFATLVPPVVDRWIDHLETLLMGSCPDARREAEVAIALLDGLLVVRQVSGADVANRAAERLLGAEAGSGGGHEQHEDGHPEQNVDEEHQPV